MNAIIQNNHLFKKQHSLEYRGMTMSRALDFLIGANIIGALLCLTYGLLFLSENNAVWGTVLFVIGVFILGFVGFVFLRNNEQ